MSESDLAGLSAVSMKAVVDVVLEVMECPVCYQELSTPIYQCNNGHVMCQQCRRRVVHCPVCKSWLHNVRALSLEKVLREVPRRCRYSEFGCTQRRGPDHPEPSCSRRPTGCAQTSDLCPWRGPLDELRHHLFDQHGLGNKCIHKASWVMQLMHNTNGEEVFMEAFGMLFRCLVRCERDGFSFMCHALRTDEESEPFRYCVTLTYPCKKSAVSYEGALLSFFTAPRRTTDSGSCLVVPRRAVRKPCVCPGQHQRISVQWRVLLGTAVHQPSPQLVKRTQDLV